MTGIRKAKQEEIAEKEPAPVLTLFAMIVPPLINAFLHPASGTAVNMMAAHAFTARKAASFIVKQNWPAMADLVWQCTFDHMTSLLFMINLGFMFIFGSRLEKKLWGWRYFVFLSLAISVPWAILYYDVQNVAPDKMFVSPLLMMLFMVGGYIVVKPVKPFTPQDWVRPSWKIFRQERKVPMLEQYWVSPWVFIIAFVVYACTINFAMNFTRTQILDATGSTFVASAHKFAIGRIDHQDQIAAFSWLAAFCTLGAGAITAPLLLAIRITTSARREGGALQQRSLLHYKELRSLDLTHEQAVEATSKFVAVPVDIVRDWIAKGQAALKQDKKN